MMLETVFSLFHDSARKRYKTSLLSLVMFSICLSQMAVAQDLPSLDPVAGSDEPAVELPSSMAALGDSISAGMLANFSRKNANMPWVETWFLLRTLTMGALFQLKGLEKKELSWSAGLDNRARVISHARRLASLDGERVLKVFNVAHSGDEVINVLETQMPQLKDWSRSHTGQDYPDYVTLLIGANDVCAANTDGMTPVNTYHERLESAISEIMSKSPRSHIMISKIPNIDALRAVAYNARLWGWGPLNKCQDAWNALKLCHTITTENNPVERAKMAQRVIDFNLVIDDVVSRYSDSYGDRIRKSDGVYEAKFTKDDLAMDCFHPNQHGQGILSNTTWQNSWWASQWSNSKEAKLKANLVLKAKCEVEKIASASPKYVMSQTCVNYFNSLSSADKNVGQIEFYSPPEDARE